MQEQLAFSARNINTKQQIQTYIYLKCLKLHYLMFFFLEIESRVPKHVPTLDGHPDHNWLVVNLTCIYTYLLTYIHTDIQFIDV